MQSLVAPLAPAPYVSPIKYETLQNKLYVDNLDKDKTTQFNNIVDYQIKNKSYNIFDLFGLNCENRQETFYQFSSEDEKPYNNLSYEMIHIIKLAKYYFDKAGLKVDEFDGRITFTSCQYNNMPLTSSPFDIHTDNEDLYDTNTCIFYTEKSDTLKGGNLDIYLEYKIELAIKTGSIVVFDGNLYHCPQSCGGTGYRNHIIVNLSTKK